MAPTRWRTPILALAAAAAAAGCVSVKHDTSWPERRPLGSQYRTFQPVILPTPGSPPPPFKEPRGVLRLKDALGYALLHSPLLEAFSWDVRAHEARTLQASLPPNPLISLRTEDVVGSGPYRDASLAETTLELGQLVELGGKRAKRRRVADLAEDVAGWDYETERIQVLTDTTHLFTTALVAQRKVTLAEQLVDLARRSLDLVNQEVSQGKASPLEHTRAQVALSSEVVERERLRAALDTSYSNLAAAWGSEQEHFDRLAGDLEDVRSPPSLQRLIARVEQNPNLARWATEIEQRKAVLDLERAQRVPDVLLNAGVRRLAATNDTSMVFGVGLPLPIVDRNQGNVLAARYELARAETQRRATRLQLLTELSSADDSLGSAYEEVTALREQVIPDAEKVYKQILEEFHAGRYAYDDVLDAQRTLFRVRSQYLDALRDYHIAVADVERLIGEPLFPKP